MANFTIEQVLRTAVEAGASDVHITVGVPPKMRVNGRLIEMQFERMLPADTAELLYSIMNEDQKRMFEDKGEHDFSYALRDLGRYRVNSFKQRGTCAMALRLVSSEIPAPEK